MELDINELSILLHWFDSVKKHNDNWLLAEKHYKLEEKLRKELLGY